MNKRAIASRVGQLLLASFLAVGSLSCSSGRQITSYKPVKKMELNFDCVDVDVGKSLESFLTIPLMINDSLSYEFILDSGFPNHLAVPGGVKFDIGSKGYVRVNAVFDEAKEKGFSQIPLQSQDFHGLGGGRPTSLLGMGVLEKVILRIDEKNNIVSFYNPQYFSEAEVLSETRANYRISEAVHIPVSYANRRLAFEATFGAGETGEEGKFNGVFYFDTGTQGIILNSNSTKFQSFANKCGCWKAKPVEGMPSGVKTPTYFGCKFSGIKIGDKVISNASFNGAAYDLSSEVGGIVGRDIFSDWKVYTLIPGSDGKTGKIVLQR